MKQIEKVQYQAALAITGTWQGSSRNKLYENLGWELNNECFIFVDCFFLKIWGRKDQDV